MNIAINIDGSSLRSVARRGMIAGALLLTTTVSAVPKTWDADDVLTAADLNGNFADLEERLLPLEAQGTRVSVSGVTPFTATAQTFTRVPYSTEKIDDLNEFSPVTNTFTASQGGDYEVCATIHIGDGNSGVPYELDVFKNGLRFRVVTANSAGAAGGASSARGCSTVRLAAGDTVDVRIYADTASAVAIANVNEYFTYLTINRLK